MPPVKPTPYKGEKLKTKGKAAPPPATEAMESDEQMTEKPSFVIEDTEENRNFLFNLFRANELDYKRTRTDFRRFLSNNSIEGEVEEEDNKGVVRMTDPATGILLLATYHLPHGSSALIAWPSWRKAFREVVQNAGITDLTTY